MTNVLPIGALYKACFKETVKCLKGSFTFAWMPILFNLLAGYYYWVGSVSEVGISGTVRSSNIMNLYSDIPSDAINVFYIFSTIYYLSLVFISLSWTEHVITKNNPKWIFDIRVLKYFFFTILIIFIIYIPILIGLYALGTLTTFSDISYVGAFLFGFVIFIFTIAFANRFILVLPAISVNNPKTGFGRSFELTSGHTLKLFVCLNVFYLLITIISALIGFIGQIMMFDQITFMLGMLVITVTQIISLFLYNEMVGRLFVYFHMPDQLKNYL